MEPTGSEKAAKIDSKGGPQGFKMEYKCMHFGNASIDFFLLTGARRKRMWALAPKTRGFSPHRKIDFRHSANFRHGNCCRRLPAFVLFRNLAVGQNGKV